MYMWVGRYYKLGYNCAGRTIRHFFGAKLFRNLCPSQLDFATLQLWRSNKTKLVSIVISKLCTRFKYKTPSSNFKFFHPEALESEFLDPTPYLSGSIPRNSPPVRDPYLWLTIFQPATAGRTASAALNDIAFEGLVIPVTCVRTQIVPKGVNPDFKLRRVFVQAAPVARSILWVGTKSPRAYYGWSRNSSGGWEPIFPDLGTSLSVHVSHDLRATSTGPMIQSKSRSGGRSESLRTSRYLF